jgi:hypothetical protein
VKVLDFDHGYYHVEYQGRPFRVFCGGAQRVPRDFCGNKNAQASFLRIWEIVPSGLCLDKKVRVAFDWTLDLLFRKDVCAVHDLPPRANSYPHELTPGWKGRKSSPSVMFSSPEILSELR